MQCPPTLPPHLKTIERCAFDEAYEGVDCVQIPDSVERMGRDAFEGVPHIIIGKSFKEYIDCLAKYDKVTVSADNPYVEIRNGFVIDKTTHTVKAQYTLMKIKTTRCQSKKQTRNKENEPWKRKTTTWHYSKQSKKVMRRQ